MALPDLLPLLRDQPWFADALRRMEGGQQAVGLPGLSVAAGTEVVICLMGVDLTCARAEDDMALVRGMTNN